jgi:hypothetical protein
VLGLRSFVVIELPEDGTVVRKLVEDDFQVTVHGEKFL